MHEIGNTNMVTQPATHKQLTKGSDAVKLLRSVFERGTLNAKSDPKTVCESDSTFYLNHRINPFRTQLNKMKAEFHGSGGELPAISISLTSNCISKDTSDSELDTLN